MKIRREHMAQHLVEYQLKMVGKSIADVMNDKEWYINNTLTTAQFQEFKKYAIAQIRKTFKCNRSKAENTFNWFNLEYGLKVKDN